MDLSVPPVVSPFLVNRERPQRSFRPAVHPCVGCLWLVCGCSAAELTKDKMERTTSLCLLRHFLPLLLDLLSFLDRERKAGDSSHRGICALGPREQPSAVHRVQGGELCRAEWGAGTRAQSREPGRGRSWGPRMHGTGGWRP